MQRKWVSAVLDKDCFQVCLRIDTSSFFLLYDMHVQFLFVFAAPATGYQ